jgi:hypothetical protein
MVSICGKPLRGYKDRASKENNFSILDLFIKEDGFLSSEKKYLLILSPQPICQLHHKDVI